MKVRYDLRKSGLYIFLEGELDDCCGERVRSEIDDLSDKYATVRSVVFDMKNLSFMDSTGIGILLGRYKRLKKRGVSVFIQSPSFAVDKVFQTSGIYMLIPKI